MVAWAREPSTTPRNRWAAAPAPWVRWVKAPSTSANTGKGDKSPVHLGPTVAAIAVSPTTRVVATSIRITRSQPGGRTGPNAVAGTGMTPAVSSRQPQTSANAIGRAGETRSTINVVTRKADTPTAVLVHHAARRARQL